MASCWQIFWKSKQNFALCEQGKSSILQPEVVNSKVNLKAGNTVWIMSQVQLASHADVLGRVTSQWTSAWEAKTHLTTG